MSTTSPVPNLFCLFYFSFFFFLKKLFISSLLSPTMTLYCYSFTILPHSLCFVPSYIVSLILNFHSHHIQLKMRTLKKTKTTAESIKVSPIIKHTKKKTNPLSQKSHGVRPKVLPKRRKMLKKKILMTSIKTCTNLI